MRKIQKTIEQPVQLAARALTLPNPCLPGTVLATFAQRPDAYAASNASNLESERILLKIADEYEALVRELRQELQEVPEK